MTQENTNKFKNTIYGTQKQYNNKITKISEQQQQRQKNENEQTRQHLDKVQLQKDR